MRLSPLVTKVQPCLGMANSCYKTTCRIYDTDYFKWEVENYLWFLVSHNKGFQSCHLRYAASDLDLAFNSVSVFFMAPRNTTHVVCAAMSF